MKNTRNLSDLGYRELEMLRDMLTSQIKYGLPDDFYEEDVQWEFNPNSGCLFFVNADYQVCMLNFDGVLEMYYTTPYSGHEGFVSELLENMDNTWNAEDIEYISNIVVGNSKYEKIFNNFIDENQEYSEFRIEE